VDAGVATPARVEACTQTELHVVDAAFQVPGCRDSLRALSAVRRDGPPSCRSCAVLEELCLQVEELWEEASRLCSIKEDEREIDRIFSAPQELEQPQPPFVTEKQVVSTPNNKGSKTSGEGEGGPFQPRPFCDSVIL